MSERYVYEVLIDVLSCCFWSCHLLELHKSSKFQEVEGKNIYIYILRKTTNNIL